MQEVANKTLGEILQPVMVVRKYLGEEDRISGESLIYYSSTKGT